MHCMVRRQVTSVHDYGPPGRDQSDCVITAQLNARGPAWPNVTQIRLRSPLGMDCGAVHDKIKNEDIKTIHIQIK